MNPFDKITEPKPRIGNRPHPITPTTLHMISYKDLCFAVEVHNGTVVFAAPCARWMEGKDWSWCLKYWRKRGVEIVDVERQKPLK